MRFPVPKVVRISILVVVLGLLVFLFWNTPHSLRVTKYDAASPTDVKFQKIAKWMPGSVEFYVAADVWRLIEDPLISSSLMAMAGQKDTVAFSFADALISKKLSVGMMLILCNFGDAGAKPYLASVVQGAFDEQKIVAEIGDVLAKGGQKLVSSEAFGGRKLYYEGPDAKDPMAFMFLDDEHMAVGNKDALSVFFANEPNGGVVGVTSSSVLQGRFVLNERIKASIPAGLRDISEIEILSADGKSVAASATCAGENEASNMKMFLEGVRSLIIFQNESNAKLKAMLSRISIKSEGKKVVLTANLSDLI